MFKKLCLFCCLLFLGSAVCLCGCGASDSDRSSYDIECTFDGDSVNGKEKVRFVNTTENTFSVLKFNLFANAFREGATYSPISSQYHYKAYYNGNSYGNINIKNVLNEKSEPLNFEIGGKDKNILLVNLPCELFPNESYALIIEYDIKLAEVIARTGINEKTVNLANFYPILCGIDENGFYECVYYSNGDPYFSDCADYNIKFTTPSDYVVASSSGVVKMTKNGGETTREYHLENARSFAFVLSKEFESISDSSTGVCIDYYYYQDDEPLKSIKTAIDSVKYFSEKFGEFPYKNYSVVQTRFIAGGMEFPGLVLISDEETDSAYREVIIHETAHQWWQTAVGNNEIEYGFLDEGLAEYSVVLFYESHPDYGYTKNALMELSQKSFNMFCSVYDKLFGNVNTALLRQLGDYKSEYEYVNIAYIEPCVMYDTLRKTIGDEKFFSGLKNYYREYKFKNATPDDIVGIYEKLNCDTNGFFKSFYEGKAII